MGNMSEMRPLIVIGTFIVTAVLLTGWMVSESPAMFSSASEGSSSLPNRQVSPTELLAWNSSYTFNITRDAYLPHSYEFTLGGWNFRLVAGSAPGGILVYTFDWWWILEWNYEDMKIYHDSIDVSSYGGGSYSSGTPWLSLSRMNSDYSASQGIIYVFQNSKTKLTLDFTFNFTKYAYPEDAIDGDGLHATVYQDYSDKNTGLNAITFISSLFTFSLPGVNSFVIALIMTPIYIGLGYIAFIFALRIVGAVFGGGGA